MGLEFLDRIPELRGINAKFFDRKAKVAKYVILKLTNDEKRFI